MGMAYGMMPDTGWQAPSAQKSPKIGNSRISCHVAMNVGCDMTNRISHINKW